jgi:hypothetical protein
MCLCLARPAYVRSLRSPRIRDLTATALPTLGATAAVLADRRAAAIHALVTLTEVVAQPRPADAQPLAFRTAPTRTTMTADG